MAFDFGGALTDVGNIATGLGNLFGNHTAPAAPAPAPTQAYPHATPSAAGGMSTTTMVLIAVAVVVGAVVIKKVL